MEIPEEFKVEMHRRLGKFARYLPPEAVREYGAYKNKEECFGELYREKCESSQFWNLAREDFKIFPNIAESLLKIPAHFPEFDMSFLYDSTKNFLKKN